MMVRTAGEGRAGATTVVAFGGTTLNVLSASYVMGLMCQDWCQRGECVCVCPCMRVCVGNLQWKWESFQGGMKLDPRFWEVPIVPFKPWSGHTRQADRNRKRQEKELARTLRTSRVAGGAGRRRGPCGAQSDGSSSSWTESCHVSWWSPLREQDT